MRRVNYERKDLGYSFALTTTIMLVASLALQLVFGSGVSGWKYWLMQSLYTVFIGGSAFVYAALSKTDFVSATRFDKRPPIAHVIWGSAAVAFLILFMTKLNNWFLDLIEAIGLNRPTLNLENNLVGLIICACVLPAFTEEVVFRGTVGQSLRNHPSKLAAVAISGALFALFHGNPAQTLHQFVLGSLLTLLILRSNSLWTSVIVHLFNNLTVVVLSYTPLGSDEFWNLQTNAKLALPLMLVGLVGFVLCVLGYLKTTKSEWNNPQVSDTADGGVEEEADKETEDGAEAEDSTPVTEREPVGRVVDNGNYFGAPLWVGIFVCAVLWIAQLLK